MSEPPVGWGDDAGSTATAWPGLLAEVFGVELTTVVRPLRHGRARRRSPRLPRRRARAVLPGLRRRRDPHRPAPRPQRRADPRRRGRSSCRGGRWPAARRPLRALREAGVAFELREYEHDPAAGSHARGAEALGLDPDTVFKTLVVDPDGSLTVRLVPAAAQLDTRRSASASRSRRPTGRRRSRATSPADQPVRAAPRAADVRRRAVSRPSTSCGSAAAGAGWRSGSPIADLIEPFAADVRVIARPSGGGVPRPSYHRSRQTGARGTRRRRTSPTGQRRHQQREHHQRRREHRGAGPRVRRDARDRREPERHRARGREPVERGHPRSEPAGSPARASSPTA